MSGNRHSSTTLQLSYVAHEEAEPQDGVQHVSCMEHMVSHAQPNGPYFLVDLHSVHNLIAKYLQGKLTKSWICPIVYYHGSHHDMLALCNHYAGKGNLTIA